MTYSFTPSLRNTVSRSQLHAVSSTFPRGSTYESHVGDQNIDSTRSNFLQELLLGGKTPTHVIRRTLELQGNFTAAQCLGEMDWGDVLTVVIQHVQNDVAKM